MLLSLCANFSSSGDAPDSHNEVKNPLPLYEERNESAIRVAWPKPHDIFPRGYHPIAFGVLRRFFFQTASRASPPLLEKSVEISEVERLIGHRISEKRPEEQKQGYYQRNHNDPQNCPLLPIKHKKMLYESHLFPHFLFFNYSTSNIFVNIYESSPL